MSQKSKYMSKTVHFGGKQLTLYSLDGCTWSTKKDELQAILERHEADKVTAAHLRGEVLEGEAYAGGNAASKPAALPKKKQPIGGFRKQPIQIPHPAYATGSRPMTVPQRIDTETNKTGKHAGAAGATGGRSETAKPAVKKKDLSAAPKPRQTSKPVAKKAQTKKRAAA